jgi:hypothetical protein
MRFGERYDESPLEGRCKKMAKIKLTVSKLSVQETLQVMQLHAEAMTGNANFPTPEPTAEDFAAAQTALQNAAVAYESARQELETLLEQRDTALNGVNSVHWTFWDEKSSLSRVQS